MPKFLSTGRQEKCHYSHFKIFAIQVRTEYFHLLGLCISLELQTYSCIVEATTDKSDVLLERKLDCKDGEVGSRELKEAAANGEGHNYNI